MEGSVLNILTVTSSVGPLLSKKPQKTPPAAKVTGVAAEHRKPGRSKKSGAAATAATGPAAPAAVAAAPRVLTKEEMDSLKQKVNVRDFRAFPVFTVLSFA